MLIVSIILIILIASEVEQRVPRDRHLIVLNITVLIVFILPNIVIILLSLILLLIIIMLTLIMVSPHR